MFIIALSTIASQDMEAIYMSTDRGMDKKISCGTIHNGILLSYKKEHMRVSSNEVDESGVYYTQ